MYCSSVWQPFNSNQSTHSHRKHITGNIKIVRFTYELLSFFVVCAPTKRTSKNDGKKSFVELLVIHIVECLVFQTDNWLCESHKYSSIPMQKWNETNRNETNNNASTQLHTLISKIHVKKRTQQQQHHRRRQRQKRERENSLWVSNSGTCHCRGYATMHRIYLFNIGLNSQRSLLFRSNGI